MLCTLKRFRYDTPSNQGVHTRQTAFLREIAMDTILAYAVFDLPVIVVARWLRRLFGLRQRRAESMAVYFVLSFLALICAVIWTAYPR